MYVLVKGPVAPANDRPWSGVTFVSTKFADAPPRWSTRSTRVPFGAIRVMRRSPS